MLIDNAHFALADCIFLVARFENVQKFMCAHHHIRLYTFSHSLRYSYWPLTSMQLEIKHITVYALARNSLADGTFHAARFAIVGIFKCTHQYLGQLNFAHI